MILKLLFEPFTDASFMTILPWFIGVMVANGVISTTQRYITGNKHKTAEMVEEYGIVVLAFAALVIAPISEELLFRGIPMLLRPESLPIFVAFTVLWALIHGRTALAVAPGGILFVKLAMGGFLLEAIVVHAAMNTVALLSFFAIKGTDFPLWPEDDEESFRNP